MVAGLVLLSGYGSALEKERLIHEPKRFTTHPAVDRDPSVSPDGKWVVFASNRNGNWDIFLKSTGGGASIQLTDEFVDEHSPRWSPKGDRIAFVSHKEDALGDVWVMKISFRGTPKPGRTAKLTDHLGFDGEPVFTPDGKGVCFTSDHSGQREIWLTDLKHRKPVRLTDGGGFSPAVSSNGGLAFVRISPETPTGEVFLLPDYRNPSDPVQITFSNLINASPFFAPTGDALVVSRIVRDTDGDGVITPDDNHTLWIIPLKPDSSIYRKTFQLTPEKVSNTQPHWGVEGNIYFTSHFSGSIDIFGLYQEGGFGRLGSARGQLDEALKFSEESPDYLLLGLESVKGYYPDTPEAAEAVYLKGEVFAREGDYRVAESYFLRVMRDYTNLRTLSFMAEIGHLRVISRYRAGQSGSIGTVANPAGFAIALDKITEREPPEEPLVNALILKGNALFQMGVFSEALEVYSEIIEDHPDFPRFGAEAKFHTAETFVRYGDPSEVVKAFLAVLKDYPLEEGWNRLAIDRIFELEVGEDEYAGYQGIIGKYRSYPKLTAAARLELARRLRGHGQIDLALQEYIFLTQLPIDNPLIETISASAVFEAAAIHFGEDKFIEATDILSQLASTSDRYRGEARIKSLNAYLTRGEKMLKGEDYELALASFERAMKIDPDDLRAHRGYIETMHRLGRGGEAYRQYTEHSRAEPGNPAYLYGQGLTLSYIDEGDPKKLEKSCGLIEAALAIDYGMIPAYLTLSYNYQALEELNRGGGVKIGFFKRVYRFTAGVFSDFWRAITFQGELQEFSGYERAIDVLTQALALNDEESDPGMEAALLLNLGNNYYSLGEFGAKNAFHSYVKMLGFDSSFGSLKTEAVICERIGRSGMFIDEFTAGRRFLKRAEEAYRRLGDDGSVFRMLLLRAELELRAGDGETSNDFFISALRQAELANLEVPDELYFTNIAFNWYKINEWDQALEACEHSLKQFSGGKIPRPKKQSYKIKFEILGISSPLGIPIPVGNLAMGASRSAEGFAPADIKSLALALMSSSQFERGEYDESAETLTEKCELAKFKRYDDEVAVCLNNLGFLAFQRGNYEEAADYYLTSIKQGEKLATGLGFYNNAANLQFLRVLLPHDYPRKAEVEELIQKSVREIESEDESAARLLFIPEKAAILGTEGNYHFSRGTRLLEYSALDSIIEGYSCIQRAWELWQTAKELLGDERESMQALMLRANIAFASAVLGDWDYGRAELQAVKESALVNGIHSLIWRIKYLQGQLELACGGGDLSEAERIFRQSASNLEELVPGKSRSYPLIDYQKDDLYRLLVRINLLKGDERTALDIAERKSCRELVEVMARREFEVKTERQKFIWSGGGGSVNYFRREIARLETELHNPELKPKQRQELENRLSRIREEYEATMSKVREDDPEFASLFSVSPVPLAEIRSMLDEDEVVLRFFQQDDGYHVWAMARDDFISGSINLNPDSLKAVMDSIEADSSGIQAPFMEELAKKILIPVADALDFYRTLLIVPDGELKRVHFGLLPLKGSPLYRNYRLSFGPSASYFYFARMKRVVGGNNVITAGVPLDSLDVGDDFLIISADSSAGRDELFETISRGDIVIIKGEFDLEKDVSLNAGFTVSGALETPVEIKVHQLFACDFTATLLILEGVNSGDIGWRALLRSLCFSGAAGMIVINPEADEVLVAKYYAELFRQLPSSSPLEAHRRALNSMYDSEESLNEHVAVFWGDGGLEPEAALKYARDNLMLTVRKGNQNMKEGNYKWAMRYYRQALEMARRLDDSKALYNLNILLLKAALGGQDWETAIEARKRLLQFGLSEPAAASGRAELSYFMIQLGRVEEASIEAEAGADLYLKLDESEKASETLLKFAQSLEIRGDYGEAEKFALKARSIQERAGLPDTALTDLFRGKILLEADSAVEGKAVLKPLIESGALKPFDAALASLFLGRCCEKSIEYFEAMNYFREAAETAPADSLQLKANAHQGMADINFKLGRYDTALENLLAARDYFSRAGAAGELYLSYNTDGLINLNMGRFGIAEKSLLKALELVEETADRKSEANIRKNLTRFYIEKGDYPKALFQARRTLELNKERGRKTDQMYDHLMLAGLMTAAGNESEAKAEFDRADELNRGLVDPVIAIRIGLGRAYLHVGAREWKDAEEALLPAYEAAEELGLPGFRWRTALLSGMIHSGRGNEGRAMDFFREAIDIVENMLWDEIWWKNRTVFLDNRFAPFDRAIELYIRNGQPAEALTIADKSKTLRWRYELFHRGIGLRSGQNFADTETDLRSRIKALTEKIRATKVNSTESKDIEIAEEKLLTARGEYSDLMSRFQFQDPVYYSIMTGVSPEIERVQSSLNDDRAVVCFHQGAEDVFVWVIKADTIVAGRASLTADELNRQVVSFRNLIEGVLSTEQTARRLYKSLMGPVEAQIADMEALVIIPAGALTELPFDALIDENGDYCIDRWVITNSFNLEFFLQAENFKRGGFKGFYAFANPDYPGVRRLEFGGREVESIAFTIPGTQTLSGGDASVGSVSSAIQKGDIIHLACHGRGSRDTRLDYALLLTPRGDSGGELTPRRVYGLISGAELVYMSACGRSLTEISNGGLLNLPHSLRFAGAGTVISSLWQADDLAAGVMAKRFYRFLAAGGSKAESLRKAKILVKEEINPHPAYWAGFQLYGNRGHWQLVQ